jgi:hypothetical protein
MDERKPLQKTGIPAFVSPLSPRKQAFGTGEAEKNLEGKSEDGRKKRKGKPGNKLQAVLKSLPSIYFDEHR